jgi:hypothetical protein
MRNEKEGIGDQVLRCMQLKIFASIEDSCSALSAYAGPHDVNSNAREIILYEKQPLTLGIRYAGPLPRTTNSDGLPLQDGSQREERRSNVRETRVDGRELTVAR